MGRGGLKIFLTGLYQMSNRLPMFARQALKARVVAAAAASMIMRFSIVASSWAGPQRAG